MIDPLTDISYLSFGKYGLAGECRRLGNIPASYLLWLYDNEDGLWQDNSDRNMPLRLYIEKTYNSLLTECPDFIPRHPYKKE